MQAKNIVDLNFGGFIRVRICGVCEIDNKYLLANHLGINVLGDYWCPPGGGVQFGEKIEETLKREYQEECHLEVEVMEFLNIFEVVKPPLHAIELFYKVKIKSGKLQLGTDPETGNDILTEVKWMDLNEIKQLEKQEIHPYFHKYLI